MDEFSIYDGAWNENRNKKINSINIHDFIM